MVDAQYISTSVELSNISNIVILKATKLSQLSHTQKVQICDLLSESFNQCITTLYLRDIDQMIGCQYILMIDTSNVLTVVGFCNIIPIHKANLKQVLQNRNYLTLCNTKSAHVQQTQDYNSDCSTGNFIANVAVAIRLRRQGIATAMLQHVLKLIEDTKSYYIQIELDEYNNKSWKLDFYEKLGFTIIDV